MQIVDKTEREQQAWAAGFFDGEGFVGLVKANKNSRQIRASIAQVARGPLDAFVRIVGVGKVYGPYQNPGPNRKPHYQWMAQSDAVLKTYLKIGGFLRLKGPQFHSAFSAREEYSAKKNPSRRGGRRLSDAEVDLVRADDRTQKDIAFAFDISQATVSRIKSARVYKRAAQCK